MVDKIAIKTAKCLVKQAMRGIYNNIRAVVYILTDINMWKFVGSLTIILVLVVLFCVFCPYANLIFGLIWVTMLVGSFGLLIYFKARDKWRITRARIEMKEKC